MKKRIGLVGFGGICKGAHLGGYKKCEDIAEITAVCDINPERLELAKELLGLPDECLFTDYNDLINSGLVDAVDICTPNDIHCKVAEAAVAAGIPYSIEKPLGVSLKETRDLLEKTNNSDVKSFVCFSYRYMADFRYMRDIVKSGKIGKIRNIHLTYLKDSGLIEGRRLEWRFDEKRAGSGVLGDLGVHMIDAVRFLGEEIDGVFTNMGITVTERQAIDSDEILPVTTDDWCNLNAMTKSGASVTMRISRVAKNIKDNISFEVHGEDGYMIYGVRVNDTGESGGSSIKVSLGKDDPLHNVETPEEFQAVQSREFVKMLCGEEDECLAHLDQGVECQKILEAAIKSAKTQSYIKIDEL